MRARHGFDYRVFGDSERTIAVLTGELDLASAPEVEAAACAFLDSGLSLTLDLRGLRFIDSAALRMLIEVEGRARRRGTALKILATPGGPIERLIAVCCLDHLLVVDVAVPPPIEGPGPDDLRALAVIATDLDGRVTRWNADAERLYGWTADEARQQSIMQLTVGAETSELAQDILRDAGFMGRWVGEFPARRKGRPPLAAFVLLAVVEDAHGTPSGMVGLSAPTDHPACGRLQGRARARQQKPTSSRNGDDPRHILAGT